MELVVASFLDAHVPLAPETEVVRCPNMRESAVVHVDIRQDCTVLRGQRREVRYLALSMAVEVVALQARCKFGVRWYLHQIGGGYGGCGCTGDGDS